MLKHYPLAIFVLLIALCKADAQIIKANILHPVFAGGASIAYEFKSDGSSTTNIYLSGGKKKDFIGIYDAYKFYNLTVEQRFYTTRKKTRSEGFFVAPYAKFMYRNYFRKGVDAGILFSSPDEALNGTTALHMIALQQGANILRVHDVKEAMEVIRLYHILYNH